MLNKEAEEKHLAQVREVAYNTMLELRDTLSPRFDANGLGYRDADHARLTIVHLMVKKMDKLAAEHLRLYGRK